MAALDWHALGEINSQPVHYRKWKVYELEETLEIPESMLSGAPYGGPVAVIRNPGKSSGAAATVAEPMEIRIYSSSGAKYTELRDERDEEQAKKKICLIDQPSWQMSSFRNLFFPRA
jgi:hypothetical protein